MSHDLHDLPDTQKVQDAIARARDEVLPLLNRASQQLNDLAHEGMDAVRDGSHQLRDSARQASRQTLGYIRDEPVKSVLLAAATGAALMALVSLLSRSRDGR